VEDSNATALYYTRAGEFEFNADGYLVNQDGFRVQGYTIDAAGNVGGDLTDITMPAGQSVPSATNELTLGLNLDADGTTYETTVTVYDSLGNPVDLTYNFTRNDPPTGAGAIEWEYYVTSTNTALTITPDSTTPNIISFTSTGAIDTANSSATVASATGDGSGHAISITGLAPADNMSVVWRFLDTTGATDGSVTSYAGDSVKSSQTQDGYPTGTLQSISVDEDGVFTGLYSNGTMLPFSQIVLANFASYDGLMKQGSNLFTPSLASGQPIYLTPNQGGVGAIAPSSLEMSNVDLATEFVELITSQRAFQANSKVITTSDEVLSELINIKR
jgi:flagellar hook protein FlgE